MDGKVYLTADEAVEILKAHGADWVSAQAFRVQAHNEPKMLGFPVCVVGTRVLIPTKPFYSFWGIEETNYEEEHIWKKSISSGRMF